MQLKGETRDQTAPKLTANAGKLLIVASKAAELISQILEEQQQQRFSFHSSDSEHFWNCCY